MKKATLRLAVLSTFLISAHSYAAAGFVALDSTGFASSAYTNCYNDGRVVPPTVDDDVKGNFGSFGIASANLPSATKNNTCWVAHPASEVLSPKAGYLPAGTKTTPIPGDTGDIGQLVDKVWRNVAKTMCIFGARVTMYEIDHDAGTTGVQLFEVNDIARGGFSGSGTVNVAYTIFSTTENTSPVYRVGRTFTSVQHRSYKYDTDANKKVNGTNYLDLPTKNSVSSAITGENTPIDDTTVASTTLATQDAVVNSNWVNFTADTVFADDDGSTNALSGFTYIEAPCGSGNTDDWRIDGAIRLRQTAQEYTTFKEITMKGFAPPGATVP